MSLFENPDYQWRDTYFVFLPQGKRPSAHQVIESLGPAGLGDELRNIREDEAGFLSLTVLAPQDSAAMDIVYMPPGEEVNESLCQAQGQLCAPKSDVSQSQLKKLEGCDARIDVFHFEHLTLESFADEEEMLDPGGVIEAVDCIAALCDGVAVDPQSGTVM